MAMRHGHAMPMPWLMPLASYRHGYRWYYAMLLWVRPRNGALKIVYERFMGVAPGYEL